MAFKRVVDPIGWRIGFVIPDGNRLKGRKCRDGGAREADVLIVDDADLPGTGRALVYRREGMEGKDPGFTSRSEPLLNQSFDASVIGCVRGCDAPSPLRECKPVIAWYHRPLADLWYQIRRVERAVAI